VIFTQEADAFRTGALTIALSDSGTSDPFIGQGWYEPEPWGRWMHGAWATLRFPASWFGSPAKVDIRFCEHRGTVPVSIACRSRILTPHGATTQSGSIQFTIDSTMCDPLDDDVTVEIQALTTVSPRDVGWNEDPRILGAGVESVTITSLDTNREPLQATDSYAEWSRAMFGVEVPKPGVLHAAKFPEGAIWAQKAHEALLGVELEYVESLLRDIKEADVPERWLSSVSSRVGGSTSCSRRPSGWSFTEK